MAYIYVLNIDDDVVGPCLELIRRIGEPRSKSKPHVTVRGPVDRLTGEKSWRMSRFAKVDCLAPGTFFSDLNSDSIQNTVFIKCSSDQFEDIHYKQDYLGSIPHITLYDGESRDFAEKLFMLLKKYCWNFEIPLPKRKNEKTKRKEYPHLTGIKIQKRKRKRDKEFQQFGEKLQTLFFEITSEILDFEFLCNLNDQDRLMLIERIVKFITKQYSSNKRKNRVDKQEEIEFHYSRTFGLRDREQRARWGQFTTPPELAFDIAKYVKNYFSPRKKVNFGDPSISTGTLFTALKRVFKESRIKSAMGVEIDASIASMTQALHSKSNLKIITGDFLRQRSLPKRNLIINNPPYVRHHFIPKEQKDFLRERVKDVHGVDISGQANLYAYFMLLSYCWMEEGAIAAWLIPAEFMDVNYGKVIREFLVNRVTLLSVHRFRAEDIQFEGVMVGSAVVVVKNQVPTKGHRVEFSYGGTLHEPNYKKEIALKSLKSLEKWPKTFQSSFKKKNSRIFLGDLFTIQRGIATGANDYFILEKAVARKIGIPKSCLKPILPPSRSIKSGIIVAKPNGDPDVKPELVVIDSGLEEEKIRSQYPKFWEYLESASENGVKDRYLVQHRNLWYKQEHRDPPPFVCTYMGRKSATKQPFQFFWNQSCAIVTNSYLCLYPRNELEQVLQHYPNKMDEVYVLLNEINSLGLSDGGRVYGGGLYKLEPRELASISADHFLKLLDL